MSSRRNFEARETAGSLILVAILMVLTGIWLTQGRMWS
jgi:hypothetical protein